MNQMAFQEDGNGGGAAAHVDHGGADLLLVLGQGGQAAGIGPELGAHHIQVAAFHRQLEVLQGAGFHRHGMHGHPDALAEHAGGIAHPPRLVHHIGGGGGLDHLMAVQLAAGAAVIQQGAQVGVGHQRPVQRHHRAAGDRDRLAAIDADQHILDAGIGHVLGGGDTVADAFLGQLQRGDGAGLEPGGFAQGAAQHLERPRLGLADDADDLGGADIQRRDKAGAIGGDFVVHAQPQGLVHVSLPLSTSFFSPFFSRKK